MNIYKLEHFRAFNLELPDSELALELAALPAELAAVRGGVVASADCDLCGLYFGAR